MDDVCKKVGIYNMENCFWRNETQYHSYYNLRILGYLDFTFCVLIIISNALVIVVFTRKSMTYSSMNTIFMHLAIIESLAGLSYAPRAWHEFFRAEECAIPQHRTFFWEEVSMDSHKLTFMFRHTGLWLAVMLAVWRYIAVIHPLKERHWCNPEVTRKYIKLGYLFGVVMLMLLYFSTQVGSTYKLLDKNGCSTSNYSIGNYTLIYEAQLPLENYPALYISASFVYCVLRILPSVVLTFTSFRLIIRLIEAKKQRQAMTGQYLNRRKDRTTMCLVLILSLFVIGEVPHGVFVVLTAYYGPAFLWRFYYYGFEICNTLTLLSESFNFIIYYTMSHQFRETFKRIMQRKTEAFDSMKVALVRTFTFNSAESSRSNEDMNLLPDITVCSSNQTP